MKFSNPRGQFVLVESAAVVSGVTQEPYVWILTNTSKTEGTVTKRSVTIGELRGDGQIEIRHGLQAGDIVVTRGVHRLSEGQKVKLPEVDP